MSTVATIKPVLRYPGAKARIAEWIVGHFPPHRIYVDAFFGGGSVLFAKPRSVIEVVNDIDDRVVNLFQVIRTRADDLAAAIALTPYARTEYEHSEDPTDDEVEKARRFLVRMWMAHSGRHNDNPGFRIGLAGESGRYLSGPSQVWARVPERLLGAVARLQDVMIECRPAVQVIQSWSRPDALIFADPPYLWSTRGGIGRGRHYLHEMTNDQHDELLATLNAHPGPVVLCGYPSEFYESRLHGWTRYEREARAYRNARRIEVLWLNPLAADTARQRPLMEIPS